MSLKQGQAPVNLWAGRRAFLSFRPIYISKWHIYIQPNMRLHFVLHLCWHLIQRQWLRGQHHSQARFNVFWRFSYRKDELRIHCDNGKQDWKVDLELVFAHYILCYKDEIWSQRGKQIKNFSSVIEPWKRKCCYFNVAVKWFCLHRAHSAYNSFHNVQCISIANWTSIFKWQQNSSLPLMGRMDWNSL